MSYKNDPLSVRPLSGTRHPTTFTGPVPSGHVSSTTLLPPRRQYPVDDVVKVSRYCQIRFEFLTCGLNSVFSLTLLWECLQCFLMTWRMSVSSTPTSRPGSVCQPWSGETMSSPVLTFPHPNSTPVNLFVYFRNLEIRTLQKRRLGRNGETSPFGRKGRCDEQ